MSIFSKLAKKINPLRTLTTPTIDSLGDQIWSDDITNSVTSLSDDSDYSFLQASGIGIPGITQASDGTLIWTGTTAAATTSVLGGGGGAGVTGYTTHVTLAGVVGSAQVTNDPGGRAKYDKEFELARATSRLMQIALDLNYHRQPDGPYLPIPVPELNMELQMKDGAILRLRQDGAYQLDDKNAKVMYRGLPTRDFNPYVNASDKLEEFIKFCAPYGIKKDEFLNLPVKHFIQWLIIEAAKKDRVPEPDDIKLIPALKKIKTPQCVTCGKFMSRAKVQKQIVHCGVPCYEKALLAA